MNYRCVYIMGTYETEPESWGGTMEDAIDHVGEYIDWDDDRVLVNTLEVVGDELRFTVLP